MNTDIKNTLDEVKDYYNSADFKDFTLWLDGFLIDEIKENTPQTKPSGDKLIADAERFMLVGVNQNTPQDKTADTFLINSEVEN